MDTWEAKCNSCGVNYKVQASSEAEAIEAAEAAHEQEAAKATAFRCDMGPMINNAFNLTNPIHPCVPRDW